MQTLELQKDLLSQPINSPCLEHTTLSPSFWLVPKAASFGVLQLMGMILKEEQSAVFPKEIINLLWAFKASSHNQRASPFSFLENVGRAQMLLWTISISAIKTRKVFPNGFSLLLFIILLS